MSSRKRRCCAQAILLLLALLVVAQPSVAADDESRHRQAGGMDIYLGVIPAEIVRGHPKEHPEGAMHGGAPVGTHHVMVALFDAASGRRITNATVTARVVWPDQYRIEKPLESMTVSTGRTYGNYFRLPDGKSAQIELQIRRPGKAGVVRATFHWKDR